MIDSLPISTACGARGISWSKVRSTSMIEMRLTKNSTPRIVGTMTNRCDFSAVAPSIRAASKISSGTPCSPARMISMLNGSRCQTVSRTIMIRFGQTSVNQRISVPVMLVSR